MSYISWQIWVNYESSSSSFNFIAWTTVSNKCLILFLFCMLTNSVLISQQINPKTSQYFCFHSFCFRHFDYCRVAFTIYGTPIRNRRYRQTSYEEEKHNTDVVMKVVRKPTTLIHIWHLLSIVFIWPRWQPTVQQHNTEYNNKHNATAFALNFSLRAAKFSLCAFC